MNDEYTKKLEEENSALQQKNIELDEMLYKLHRKVIMVFGDPKAPEGWCIPIEILQRAETVLKYDPMKRDFKTVKDRKDATGKMYTIEEAINLTWGEQPND